MVRKQDLVNQVKGELLLCGHCGNIPEVFHTDCFGDTFVGDRFLIECDCGIGSVDFDTKETIIENWNRRVRSMKKSSIKFKYFFDRGGEVPGEVQINEWLKSRNETFEIVNTSLNNGCQSIFYKEEGE